MNRWNCKQVNNKKGIHVKLQQWLITAIISGTLCFTAATNPKEFPSVARQAMPVLALSLKMKDDK